ncbi:MAG TPA: RHS repeat-associated core domain-containing protein [Verrucomicrobiae bacterium]|nr:RHS repeat-associated core domain-containing protein [Verrucomicrobiae bacterium]
MPRKTSFAAKALNVVLVFTLASPEPSQLGVVAGSMLLWAGASAAKAAPSIGAARILTKASPAPIQLAPLSFSASPSDSEIFNARVFDEPLVPVDNQPTPGENRALATALYNYAHRAVRDDCSSLAAFAEAFPDSRWTGTLLLHLGTEYYNNGYFSKALAAWEQSWTRLSVVSGGPSKVEADRALGELARMYSRLGRVTEMAQLLDGTHDRDLEGPATQLVGAAQGALWMMQNKPDHCFKCGPLALDRILLRIAPEKAGTPLLNDYKSGPEGFSLSQVAEISGKLGMNYQMAFREAGAAFIVPSVVHWKVGHYAALVERSSERILAQDYTFRGTFWMSLKALGEEASGYFLVPPGPLPAGWRKVSEAEAQKVWGRGYVGGQDPNATGDYDTTCGGCNLWHRFKNGVSSAVSSVINFFTGGPSEGMPAYTIHAMLASLTLNDIPVGYTPPVGPPIYFRAAYHQREANQPAIFSYSNLGQKWTHNWLSYITDSPGSVGGNVALYLDGGGTLNFTGFDPATQSYRNETMSSGRLVVLSSSSYELQFPDGSRKQFAQSDGSSGSTRRIFLTQVIDPAGNSVQLNYDAQLRVTNIVDAIGQSTTLLYTNSAYPFAVTSVIDPFGRSAQFQYNASGLLAQITDAVGMTSQFSYSTNQFVSALTTPYGTTTFATGQTNSVTYVQATDPLGASELVVYSQQPVLPHALPASQVPHGLSTFNLFIDARNSFFWDKRAFAEGPADFSKAKIYHWLHYTPIPDDCAPILESEQESQEARVWYNYPGQSTNDGAPYYLDAAYTGASAKPSVVMRILDDGGMQTSLYSYNAFGNVTNSTDPVGRTFSFVYASNQVDLLEVRMTRNGKNELVSRTTYNAQHLPLTVTDAAGQTTVNAYNSRGQLISQTNAKGQVSTFSYDANGFLLSATGPLSGPNDSAKFTYDAVGRIQTFSDTEGYKVTLGYDNLDRVTSISYPDGTSEQRVFDKLDLAAVKDRLGHWTTNSYNAIGQLVSTQDPLGRVTQYEWCKCGALTAMTDPMGRTTRWMYDAQSRAVAKQYPDGSMETVQYEANTSRVRMRQDAAGQQTLFDYYPDNSLKRVSYFNAAVATPPVSFTYDPDYLRVTGVQDGAGASTYSYYPITSSPTLGAGKVQSVSGPLPNSLVTYQYDELGRVLNRTINGVGQNVVYDPLGRVTSATNILGTFRYSYVNATARPDAIVFPNGQSNVFSYYNGTGDERLKQISNFKPDGSLLSSFGYTYNSDGEITSWTNQWDTLPLKAWALTYDSANQLTAAVRTDGQVALSTNSYTYDNAGNRLAVAANGVTNLFSYNALNEIVSGEPGPNGAVTYEWDAAKRLSAINQGTHRSEFSYDAMNRRVRQVEKSNGLVVLDHYFLWCGDQVCEERDSTGGNVVRRFFAQGENVVGPGTTNLYYTRDHLGSIREAMDSAGTLVARYDYDPYGRQTALAESLAPAFGFSGLFQHRPTGLYFALNRALDPYSGRWLNRDPLGEAAGFNLYTYVGNDPVNVTDPAGEFPPLLLAIPMIIGAAGGLALAIHLSTNGTVTSPCAQGFLIFGLTVGGAIVGLGVGVALTALLPVLIPTAFVAAPAVIYNGPIIERFIGRITNTGG